MKRTRHNLSNMRLTTLDMGQLIPVQVQEILPADSMLLETSALVRCSPLLAPVMHPTTIRFHHWFVPSRILWDGWEDFITGGPNNDNVDTIPSITISQLMIDNGLCGYLGIPEVLGLEVNSLPLLAYNKIFNEFYRDQDLKVERLEDDTTIAKVAWGKDYFTTARPWRQKGPELSLPIGTEAPVVATSGEPWLTNGTSNHYLFANPDGRVTSEGAPLSALFPRLDGNGLSADLTNATGMTAVQFREFFALQRYAEARANYGSRYSEYLRYLGVRPSDGRLQRPEYLGGGKSQLQFSEVLSTFVTDTSQPQGSMTGHGISALKTRRTKRFFDEHGYVITLMSVVPKAIYQDGIQRFFLKQDKEDFYQKELQDVGMQAVYQGEIDCSIASNIRNTFGYSERYSDYTWSPSLIQGEFKTLLDFWHMGRKFGTPPALNGDFITCDPAKRIFAEQTKNGLWCMINNRVSARRLPKRAGVGRLM